MSYLHKLREYVTPVLQTSDFKSGLLTPEEFIQAGDYLVYKCPTWEWSGGVESKRRPYFKDPNKQYLVSRNLPCSVRCDQVEFKPLSEEAGWTIYQDVLDKPKEVPIDIDEQQKVERDEEAQEKSVDDDEEEDEQNEKEKEGSESDFILAADSDSDVDVAAFDDDGIVKTRTYDLYITYDNYYRTPRVWLYGYDENGHPLSEKEMFQDVAPTHAMKTVTYEVHPHEKYTALSIHPCKHSSTMKKLIERYKSTSDIKDGLRPDQYLFLFLKFIGTVIPTISYDYTMSM